MSNLFRFTSTYKKICLGLVFAFSQFIPCPHLIFFETPEEIAARELTLKCEWFAATTPNTVNFIKANLKCLNIQDRMHLYSFINRTTGEETRLIPQDLIALLAKLIEEGPEAITLEKFSTISALTIDHFEQMRINIGDDLFFARSDSLEVDITDALRDRYPPELRGLSGSKFFLIFSAIQMSVRMIRGFTQAIVFHRLGSEQEEESKMIYRNVTAQILKYHFDYMQNNATNEETAGHILAHQTVSEQIFNRAFIMQVNEEYMRISSEVEAQ